MKRTPYQIDRELASTLSQRINIERAMKNTKNRKHLPLPIILQGQSLVSTAKTKEATMLVERRAAVVEV